MVVGAMIGFVALIGAYATTGQIIPVFSNGHPTGNRREGQWSCHDAWSDYRHS